MLNRLRTYLSFIRFSHSVFALPFALAGALLGALRNPPGERGTVFGDQPISAGGEPGEAREDGRREATARQGPQQWRQRVATRASLAGGGDQMPGGHALGGRELHQQIGGLGPLQRDRRQARRTVPPQQQRQRPLAEAAVGVI